MTIATLAVRLRPYMPFVTNYERSLSELGLWWQKVTLIGKINSQQVAATLLDDMEDTKYRFEELQVRLVNNLVEQNVHKLDQEIGARAQVAIDILIRNLFERTADVGFLATDDDIRAFLRNPEPSPQDQEAMVARLLEYTQKYSVYDEIIILDAQGSVRAHLDPANPVSHSTDPLIRETLTTFEPYLEIFRPSDLQPLRSNAHIFSAKITDSDAPHAPVLGILCLCFRFENEMSGIFDNLVRAGEMVAILNSDGQVIATSDSRQLATGSQFPVASAAGLRLIPHRDADFLARTTVTKGYQGYHGLAWQGHVMHRAASAFSQLGDVQSQDEVSLHRSRCIPDEIRHIGRSAELVTDDLTLIVLNGQIISAKRDAKEFMPVLDEIRTIGQRTKGVFDDSISRLHNTVIGSLLSEVQFQAFLAVDIMDRNLYERANDVRWWALTNRFRKLLSKPEYSGEDLAILTNTLEYINSLYTVYTNLFVFDIQRRILAVSNGNDAALVNTCLPDLPFIQSALAVKDSQRYVVSPFDPTPLYSGNNTYVYLTSILSPDASMRVVGGIGIVFDSQPQFAAMLEDALPRDDNGLPLAGAFDIFAERHGRIIASTHPDKSPGEMITLDERFIGMANGARDSAIIEHEGQHYAVGAAMSQGYREYKTTGDYENDVLALIFVPT